MTSPAVGRGGAGTRSAVSRRLLLSGLLTAALLLLLPAQPASAHPLGNFTVNEYSRVEIGRDVLRVRYVVDMAEIPTVTERQRIDGDRDGQFSQSEVDAYLEQETRLLVDGLQLSVDGHPTELRLKGREISFPVGQAGLPTLRLVLDLEASIGQAERWSVEYRHGNFRERLGWREIVAVPGPGAVLLDSTVPAEDSSNELRSYPPELLTSPLDVREARVTAQADADEDVGASAPAVSVRGVDPGLGDSDAPLVIPGSGRAAGGVSGVEQGILGILLTRELTPTIVVGSLLLAAALGAWHALTPGHGKTVMAAYLVGTRGTTRHALGLGLTVTVSHTLGVLALGVAVVFAANVLPPERLFPVLAVASGLIVVAIGLYLLAIQLHERTRRRRQRATHEHEHEQGYGDAHAGEHGHEHGHGDAHGGEHDHDHAHAERGAREHRHEHTHEETERDDEAADGWHSHGLIRHSHVPERADAALSWRGLFALGLSGGLVPSIPALLLLIGSIALGRPAYGIVLTIVFGIGMAVVLVGVGVLLVRARALMDRLPTGSVITRWSDGIPLLSALVVLAAGVLITVQALARPAF